MNFTSENMNQIILTLSGKLKKNENKIIEFRVINPDLFEGLFNGEKIEIKDTKYIMRSYKTWIDLAEIFDCRFLTPEIITNTKLVKIKFKPLNKDANWHKTDKTNEKTSEKYGINSDFFRLNKLEEPYFMKDYFLSLKKIQVKENDKILNLGINRGDEFIPFRNIIESDIYKTLQFTGIDHSKTAIEYASNFFAKREKSNNFKFIAEDINKISEIENLGKFNHIISIGTLQSPKIDSKNIFHKLIQSLLEDQDISDDHVNNSIILGFPNCRYIDGELKYGAKTKNYNEPELSLMLKDVLYYKRYLQQHKFKVTVTGKYYLFLTAIR